MTCEALINKFLVNYQEGTLPLARKIDFELHLALCSACRRYVDSYRKTVALAKQAATGEEEVPEELVNIILAMTREGR